MSDHQTSTDPEGYREALLRWGRWWEAAAEMFPSAETVGDLRQILGANDEKGPTNG